MTFREPAQCDAALASGVSFRGTKLHVSPVDARTRLVYVRDLSFEVPDDLELSSQTFSPWLCRCPFVDSPGLP